MDVKNKEKIEALRAFMISSTAISMLNEADLRFLQRNILAKSGNSLECVRQASINSYIYEKIFSRNLSRYKTYSDLVGEDGLYGEMRDAWSVYNVFERYFKENLIHLLHIIPNNNSNITRKITQNTKLPGSKTK
jgi:hypothetical protein